MGHCNNIKVPLTRRAMLGRCANGFGAVALTSLLSDEARSAAGNAPDRTGDPLAPRATHFEPRAKNVIFLFMDGGPSQVDTFDPKPRLDREHGQPIKMDVPPTQFDNVGTVLKSPWKFRPRGESGIPVSDLFPHVAECVDDMAIIRSMTSAFPEHTNANYFLHSGSGLQGRPSMGAWTTYGLGSECRDLPGFVVLDSGMIPPGGLSCFTSGFLPASFQASIFKPGERPVANLYNANETPQAQRSKLGLIERLDAAAADQFGTSDKLEAAINNYELAFRMQAAVPNVTDLSSETAATRRLYGLDEKKTHVFGHQCLVARRLVERGVRFVEILPPKVGGDRWDQHSRLREGHQNNADATDRPVAALLRDLKARGLLNETLVVWGGEFGRTPMAQGSDGRDHNPFGFSMWMAGGGVRGGTVYGETDEYGYFVIDRRAEIHDLHATMLHLLGLDHERLTFRFSGRDMRLTDVKGHVLHEILA